MSQKIFGRYLHLRTVSVVGDEIWRISIPLYAANSGWRVEELGFLLSITAIAEVVGYLFAPKLLGSAKSFSKFAARIDLFQFILFSAFFFALSGGPAVNNFFVFVTIATLTRFLSALWFVTSESLMPRLQHVGNAQEVQRQNFTAWSLGSSLAPPVATIAFNAIGVPFIALFNCLSFIGQSVLLNRLSSLEEMTETTPKTSHTFSKSFSSGLSNGFIVWSTIFANIVRVFCMGAIPFILFKYASYPNWILIILASAHPISTFLGARFWKSGSDNHLNWHFGQISLLLLISGMVCTALIIGSFPIWPTIISLLIFGLALGIFTVQARAIRQIVLQKSEFAKIVSAQTLFGRLSTPLSGVLFSSLLSASDSLTPVSMFTICVATLCGLICCWKMMYKLEIDP